MTKRKLKQILLDRVTKKEFWQEKPYTAANVTVEYRGNTYEALGFSKVCYPDRFDPEFGKELAVKKAVSKVAGLVLAMSEAGL